MAFARRSRLPTEDTKSLFLIDGNRDTFVAVRMGVRESFAKRIQTLFTPASCPAHTACGESLKAAARELSSTSRACFTLGSRIARKSPPWPMPFMSRVLDNAFLVP